MAIPFSDPADAGTGSVRTSSADDVRVRLRRHARFEDPGAGRAEEQAYIATPGGPVFTTLVEPLGGRRRVGFLLCHSFAFEQLDLFPLELTFARQAASAGFPALYFQARGYADSGGDLRAATPHSHLQDALAAAEHLRRSSGVEAVVPVGTRLGAAVALMAADLLGSPGVVGWNAALEPGAYLDDLLKVFARSRIASKSSATGQSAGPTREQLQATLAGGEDVDLFGYPLSPTCYRDAAATHPIASLERPPPRALLVVVNPRTEREAAEVAERLRGAGTDARVEHAEGPGRAQFGLGASPAGRRVVTGQALFDDVARRTVAWADAEWPETASAASDPSPVVTIEEGISPADSAIAQEPVYIESGGERLGAVLAVPEDRDSSVGVVLLASRARDRAHRNGLWVRSSRTLAEDGMYALRIDYPGVGNSTGSPRLFGADDVPSWAVEDACRFLVEHTPVRRILLAGTCYGGRVVLDAAPRIPQVEGVAVIVAPVLGPLTSVTRMRLRAARFLGLGKGPSPDPAEASSPKVDGRESDRRVDPAFAAALKRFLTRGRVCFLYGDQDHLWAELRFALDRLKPPADRYEVDLVPGEIDSFRSVAMQEVTHERLVAWCRRSAEDLREGV